MHQVLPHLLWLGHAREGQDYRQVFEAGIRALVDLAAEEPPSKPPRELIYFRVPLLDGPDNEEGLLLLAISTVATLLRMHVPTLVCCGAGMSRSPAVAAAALAMVRKEPPEEALKRVVKDHPSDVSPGLWRAIVDLVPTIGIRNVAFNG